MLKTDKLSTITWNKEIRIEDIASLQDIQNALNHINHKTVEEYDTTNRSFWWGWADGKIWSTQTLKWWKNLLLNLSIPARNDTENWWWLYTEVKYRLNNGNWTSLWHSWYDGVMGYRARLILTYNKSFLVFTQNQIPQEDYTIQFKFRHRSYNGTTHINRSHDLSGERFGTILRLEEK